MAFELIVISIALIVIRFFMSAATSKATARVSQSYDALSRLLISAKEPDPSCGKIRAAARPRRVEPVRRRRNLKNPTPLILALITGQALKGAWFVLSSALAGPAFEYGSAYFRSDRQAPLMPLPWCTGQIYSQA